MQATVNLVRQTDCSFSLAKFLRSVARLTISDVTSVLNITSRRSNYYYEWHDEDIIKINSKTLPKVCFQAKRDRAQA